MSQSSQAPVSLQRLRQLLEAGTLTLDTRVYHAFCGWRLLGKVLQGEAYFPADSAVQEHG